MEIGLSCLRLFDSRIPYRWIHSKIVVVVETDSYGVNTLKDSTITISKTLRLLNVFCISRVYEDDEDDREGGSEEERAFRCKLIADEFKKRRKVAITI